MLEMEKENSKPQGLVSFKHPHLGALPPSPHLGYLLCKNEGFPFTSQKAVSLGTGSSRRGSDPGHCRPSWRQLCHWTPVSETRLPAKHCQVDSAAEIYASPLRCSSGGFGMWAMTVSTPVLTSFLFKAPAVKFDTVKDYLLA